MAAISNNIFKSIPEEGSYSDLLQKRAAGDPIDPAVLETAKLRVLRDGFTGRFIYQVSLAEKPVGYLVGTYHHVNQKMANDPALQKTILQCEQVFFECTSRFSDDEMIGSARKTEQMIMKELESSHLAAATTTPTSPKLGELSQGLESLHLAAATTTPTSPKLAGLSMDQILHDFTNSQGIATGGLDTKEELLEMKRIYEENKEFNGTAYKVAQGTLLWMHTRSKLEQCIELLQYYQKGDALQTDSFARNSLPPLARELLITSRNTRWAEKLTSRFRETTKPIGVVVGIGHLLGRPEEKGLIDLFRKAGFTVARHVVD